MPRTADEVRTAMHKLEQRFDAGDISEEIFKLRFQALQQELAELQVNKSSAATPSVLKLGGGLTCRRFVQGMVLAGHYRIVREVGRGGMGVVYLADDENFKDQRQVALKVLPDQLRQDPESVAQFKQEFVRACGLVHQHICAMHEFGEDSGQETSFLVLEYVPGQTLRALLRAQGPYELEQALGLIAQMAQALDFAHSQGILHLDFKPANVMVKPDGMVKVMDFGLAQQIGTSMSHVTMQWNAGTPLYMAPEQLDMNCARRKVSMATDVWSLGVSVYELLSGAPPFEAPNALVLTQCILQAEPDPIAGLAPAAWSVLKRALSKDPQSRYRSAGEFYAALQNSQPNAASVAVATSVRSAPAITAKPCCVVEPSRDDKNQTSVRSAPATTAKRKPSRVQVLPAVVVLQPGDRQLFCALVYDQNDKEMPAAVKWETSGGAIDAQGNYVASSAGNYEVRAWSGAVCGRAKVEVARVAHRVEIRPGSVKLQPGGRQGFGAVVYDQDDNPMQAELRWSATGGEINEQGVYRAGEHAGNFVVTVAVAGAERIASQAKVTIIQIPHRLEVKPAQARMIPGAQQQFSAVVYDQDDNPMQAELRWSATGGEINEQGVYRAGEHAGNFVVTVAVAGAERIASQAKVTVISIPPQKRGWFGEEMPAGMRRGKKRGEYIWAKDQSVMVYVPPGPFWRGSKEYNDEKPVRQIELSGYYIDKYLITWRQYLRFCKATGYRKPKKPRWGIQADHPVVNVSWGDLQAYVKWAGKHLPSEAQWEKAARGGLEIPDWESRGEVIGLRRNPLPQRRYPWGDEWDKFKCNNEYSGLDKTSPVGSYPNGVSPYGCHDLSGNVWEWCQDVYAGDYYAHSPAQDPVNDVQSTSVHSNIGRLCRGGSWAYGGYDGYRCAYRYRGGPSIRYVFIGGRAARS